MTERKERRAKGTGRGVPDIHDVAEENRSDRPARVHVPREPETSE